MRQKCILVITDGIGFNKEKDFNAFEAAKKPNYERLFKEVPNSLIKTSGLAVGLPENQMGNSEVGHMCIGSGQIIYQNLVRINKAIESYELEKNANLKKLLQKCKRVHVIGLYSDGGVHSMDTHFNALLEICAKNGNEVFAHAITDGRDVSPTSGLEFIKKLKNHCEKIGVHFATLCGRFYAMDRDKRWERVKEYYDCLLGQSEAIATNLYELSDLKTPTIAVVIGEGGSGGALAIGVADKLAMMKNSVFSVISPEGCAAILWNDPSKSEAATKAMKVTADDLKSQGLIDDVIEEPINGAHRNKEAAAVAIADYVKKALDELEKIDPRELASNRMQKILQLGAFSES